MGRDDFGYYRVRIDDELRDGEEEDIITQVRFSVLSSDFAWSRIASSLVGLDHDMVPTTTCIILCINPIEDVTRSIITLLTTIRAMRTLMRRNSSRDLTMNIGILAKMNSCLGTRRM